jgi:hypothetical protein
MVKVERGKVEGGGIVFDEPLALPHGTEVTVSIKTLADEEKETDAMEATDANVEDDFTSIFGMWADREDMVDSVAWVRRMREQWHQRVARRD